MTNIDRRQFIAGTATALACAVASGLAGAGPHERMDFGLLLKPADAPLDAELRTELRRTFYWTHLRADHVDRGYYVQAREDQAELLKGTLKRWTRVYRVAALHKPVGRNVYFYPTGTLRRSRGLDLGAWRPERLGELLGVGCRPEFVPAARFFDRAPRPVDPFV